ncbi:unnamed protein product [Eruca vesicaria subsp. sativa]|uniref:Defensin-like protein n=1 Tax=Eruca vesicaria subsp. sativa TaxID=29727 RepID=A0ABC8J6V2_ERUVS|nr:unnamed protein product [Eruca vesicaria subsp. sativa]
MERITQVVLLVTLLIMFTSVVNQARAKSCVDTLGTCDEFCEERCTSKHGLKSVTKCDRSFGLCKCYYSASDCGHNPEVPPGPPHTT